MKGGGEKMSFVVVIVSFLSFFGDRNLISASHSFLSVELLCIKFKLLNISLNGYTFQCC